MAKIVLIAIGVVIFLICVAVGLQSCARFGKQDAGSETSTEETTTEPETEIEAEITVNGIQIHGLTKSEAMEKVLADMGWKMKVTFGDGFLRVHRGCLVAVMAIHNVTDTINLSNGESLGYTARKKGEIMKTLRNAQQDVIRGFQNHGVPMTDDEYHDYYRSFDQLPFAFTDIEMVFDEEKRAVDWIFRYGNPELARLEKLPLDRLIGNSFGSLFSNMDSKWLRSYERAVLYGENWSSSTTARKSIQI